MGAPLGIYVALTFVADQMQVTVWPGVGSNFAVSATGPVTFVWPLRAFARPGQPPLGGALVIVAAPRGVVLVHSPPLASRNVAPVTRKPSVLSPSFCSVAFSRPSSHVMLPSAVVISRSLAL